MANPNFDVEKRRLAQLLKETRRARSNKHKSLEIFHIPISEGWNNEQ